VMPTYVSAIENTINFVGRVHRWGFVIEKGTTPKSRIGLWRRLVTPEEQEIHLLNLRYLSTADFEEYHFKCVEKIQLRIYEAYQEQKHARTLQVREK